MRNVIKRIGGVLMAGLMIFGVCEVSAEKGIIDEPCMAESISDGGADPSPL